MSRPAGGLAARLRAAFLGDLEEQLAALNGGLLALEADPRDAAALRQVFRAMHTLKGAAHASGQPLVARASHHLEALLAEARDGRLDLEPKHFELLFLAADALADVAARVSRDEPLAGETPIGRLAALLERGELPPVAAPAASPAGAAAPASSVAAPVVTPPVSQAPGEASVRVSPAKLDVLLTQVGRLLAARSRVAEHTEEVEGALARIGTAHARLRRLLSSHAARLPADLAETLHGVERDLRAAASEAAAVSARGRDDLRALDAIGDALADGVRRVRMVPFATACEPLLRLVRDVANEVGKPAKLVVQGGEVEADRPVLDSVREALLHLVRNAIDHGLEPAAARADARKPAVGTVTVRAALQGERLLVTVSDDGAGLDVAAIRRRLAERGGEVPGSDADVVRTLFESGLSTRDVATSISGRGVGLDAVQAAMERVRGTVDVRWEPGRGTTFVLESPLTLAAIRAVLVRAGGQLFALPTSNVERLARVRAAEVRRVEGRDVLLTSGAPIPLVSLAAVLGPPLTASASSDIVPALVVSAGGRSSALVVEQVEGEQEIVVRAIARGRWALPHLSGGALIGGEQVALVLNPVSLVQSATASAGAPPAVAPGPSRPRILVVDDSLTTRALEQSVLEAAGYEVVTAVDGADAWRKLQESGADLLVSDIEMPNMDGLTLCRRVRASDRFANLPVVLVTSLDRPDDRVRGLSAGADAYVGKASAGQAGLLDTVRELLA